MTHHDAPSTSSDSFVSRNPAGVAVLAGGLLALGVMAVHPTGADAIADTDGSRHVLARAGAVHAVAVAALPLLFAGMAALSWRLRAQRTWSVLAVICAALATVAVMSAAAMSGFVAPVILRGLAALTAAQRDVALQQLHYTALLNQAFAKVYVGLMAGAFIAWSVAMRRDGQFPAALRWYAAVCGPLPLLGVAVGHLQLDVRGFGLVTLLHVTWLAWATQAMRRHQPESTYAGAR